MSDAFCDRVMEEISVAHDERRAPEDWAQDHLRSCTECSAFSAAITDLDLALAPGRYEQAADLAPTVIAALTKPRREWWSVAAVALVGLLAGAVVGIVSTRTDIGQAQDLSEILHTAAGDLDGFAAELLVVERGLHEDVPERVYTGTLDYVAPERLAINLIDTTRYPDDAWIPNDVRLVISDGDMVDTSATGCPVAALPECLVVPSTRALVDQPPFNDGVLIPLEIVGPGRTLDSPGGFEVLGTTQLDGEPTIQVRSTVAAVELIRAVTDRGSWRELHPTDPVVMWLDETTMVPLRVEVFTAESPERELWQLRRDYHDDPEAGEPIFILELSDPGSEPGPIEVEIPDGAASLGFVEGDVVVPEPELPDGFEAHRAGHWPLPEGDSVDMASWSDGRAWIAVQVTRGWGDPRLFGLSTPFVKLIELGDDSAGYLSPAGDAIAIHGEDIEILVTGSVSPAVLARFAASLNVRGQPVPDTWLEASTSSLDTLPEGTLVPEAEGWSILSRIEGTGTTLLLSGGGARNVIVTQGDGSVLGPPTGPDFSEIEVRGSQGRHDSSSSTLEWVEDGQIVRMRSDTVGVEEMIALAEAMVPR